MIYSLKAAIGHWAGYDLWTWPDGWRLFRPCTPTVLCSMFDDLKHSHGYRESSDARYQWVEWNADASHGIGTSFLLAPRGDGNLSAFAMQVTREGGVTFNPREYKKGLRKDVIRHVYDLVYTFARAGVAPGLLAPENDEDLLYPLMAGWGLSAYQQLSVALQRFARDGWEPRLEPSQRLVDGHWRTVNTYNPFPRGVQVTEVDSTGQSIVLTLDGTKIWKQFKGHDLRSLRVTVQLPIGAVWPVTVENRTWGETATGNGDMLDDVFAEAGLIARNEDEFLRALDRRRIVGTPSEEVSLSLLLGTLGAPFFRTFDEMEELQRRYDYP